MRNKKSKSNNIYSVVYGSHKLYYFDDSIYKITENDKDINEGFICKVSEIVEYIDELNELISKDNYLYDGLCKLPYKQFENKKEELAVVIDLNYSFKSNMEKLNLLEYKNSQSFNVPQFIKGLNLSSQEDLRIKMAVEKLYLMKNDSITYLILEYCNMRKYAQIKEVDAKNIFKRLLEIEYLHKKQ